MEEQVQDQEQIGVPVSVPIDLGFVEMRIVPELEPGGED